MGQATGDDVRVGVLWSSGTAQPTVLGPADGGAQITGAADINDRGVVVGPAEVPRSGPSGMSVIRRSYVWRPSTRSATLLAAAPGSPSGDSMASAINRHGIIVGVAQQGDVVRLAVWNACGTPIFLQPTGGSVYSAAGVNRYGRTVGIAATAPPTDVTGVEWDRSGPCTPT